MDSKTLSETAHPWGEENLESILPENNGKAAGPLPVDTNGGRYHVQWDDSAPMTPLGRMVFFAQFLQAGGRWEDFCKEAPLWIYESERSKSRGKRWLQRVSL
jgi:hypothetical protein